MKDKTWKDLGTGLAIGGFCLALLAVILFRLLPDLKVEIQTGVNAPIPSWFGIAIALCELIGIVIFIALAPQGKQCSKCEWWNYSWIHRRTCPNCGKKYAT